MNDSYRIIEILENNPEIEQIMKNCPYEILQRWKVREFPKNHIIFHQGMVYESFNIVVDGLLNVYTLAKNGRMYSQAVYEKGNFIGELEIFDKRPFICTIEALTPVKLLELDRESFLTWIKHDSNLSYFILRTICKLFYTLSEKASQDTLYPLKYRLCDYLISRAKPRSGAKCEISIDKEAISNQMAVTQRSINRVLYELKKKGIIEVNNNLITLHDVEALKKEAENGCNE